MIELVDLRMVEWLLGATVALLAAIFCVLLVGEARR